MTAPAGPAPASGPDGPITVAIVPHTHWDREWYAPFQTFRVRLVRLLDELLELLDRDLGYARFLLDGQTAVLDDYLQVRPHAVDALRRLATSGRISIGPWAILMDEYMVSGETIVRDLQMGMARATELGGAMPVGYLPDMFGHVAQMPQLLRLAGLEHTVVWRGVPSAVRQTAFWWEAPDGSRVRAEYLWGSYSNGRDLPDDGKQLVARARGYDVELGRARLAGGGLLLMNGTDHQLPQPWLGRVVDEANAIQDDYRFVVTSLPEYLADQPSTELTTWRGELRSGARANVLMGVASNRVDVHQLAAAAERSLERHAEPLQALFRPADLYADAELAIAWRLLVLNSAHDSSCACSADDVVDAVSVRYQEARHIGEALGREALRALAARIDAPAASTVVVNPTAVARGGLIPVSVPGEGPLHLVAADDGEVCAAQVVAQLGGESFSTTVAGEQVGTVLDMMRGPEFAGARIARTELTVHDDGTVDVIAHAAARDERGEDLDPLRERLLELALADPSRTLRFRVLRAPVREAVVAAGTVPGFGWRTFVPVDGPAPHALVRAEGRGVANAHLRVEADADGTFTITTAAGEVLAGLGRLVEGGDGGDTYNYSPPEVDRIVDAPVAVRSAVVESGPVRGRIVITAEHDWPAHAIGDARHCTARSDDVVRTTVTTTLDLHGDEAFVRVTHELDHRVRDHRVRAHFPLPTTVRSSHAECAFAVVERGLTAEGGPHEVGLPTFVSRRFVDASDGERGLALLHDGLLEYEIVDEGRELALTLVRATGYLSRSEMLLRPNPAGPLDPLEGPQLQRPLCLRYAVLAHDGDWAAAGLHAAADAFLTPLERVRGGGWRDASAPVTGQELAVDGAVVTAVLREGGALVVRAHNPYAEARELRVSRRGAPASGWVVDLLGRPLDRFEGTTTLPPGRITTLRLTD